MKIFEKPTTLAKGLTALALACCLGPAQGAVVALLPAVQSVRAGGEFQLQIHVSGLGDLDAPALYRYDIGVSFEPSMVAFIAVAFGDSGLGGDQLGLVAGTLTSSDSTHNGLVFLHEEQGAPGATGLLEDLQPDSFVLATLSFQSIAPGTSRLGVFTATLFDGLDAEIPQDFGLPAASVTAAVPEPSCLALLIVALGGLGLTRALTRLRSIRV